MTRTCISRSEVPLLSDLPEAIGEAIPLAISRCQEFMKQGYGDSLETIKKLDSKQCIPATLFSNALEKERSETESQKGEALEGHPSISKADVPQQLLRSWSIVNQSSQMRVGAVASSIVLNGADSALNRQAPQKETIVKALVDAVRKIAFEAWQEAINFGKAMPEVEAIKGQLRAVRKQILDWLLQNRPRKKAYREWLADPDIVEKPEDANSNPWNRLCEAIQRALASQHSAAQYPISLVSDYYSKEIQPVLNKLVKEATQIVDEIVRLPDTWDPVFEPVAAPILRLGPNFTVVDRREIEGVRSIQKLIKDHLDQIQRHKDLDPKDKTRRPLSLAVFGPPGSGKSSVVKSIVGEFAGHATKTHSLPAFNLAQFTKEDDLSAAFSEVVDASAEEEVPIAFFDEFDCRFQNDDWGWLKFFLSPMEDGKYRGKPVNNAILVFAGGTSSTFSEFSLENRPRIDPQFQAFSRAKGTDFVSRLNGHLNVVGINPADPDDELYLIRRAIVVRSILTKIQDLKEGQQARIDFDMLRAILLVPTYTNGVRSLRMLLEVCSRSPRQVVSKSALPLIQQLNMLCRRKGIPRFACGCLRGNGKGS